MDTVIVLFNRDLRVHDHPALSAACAEARRVIPLFVLDEAVPTGRRVPFLLDCLADLRASLRALGGDLVVRRGEAVAETVKLAVETSAEAIYVSGDVSGLARNRERELAAECARHRLEFRTFPGATVVPPDALSPIGGTGHYKVFTPYWRVWSAARRREPLGPPVFTCAPGVESGTLPSARPYGVIRGGESRARERVDRWLPLCLGDYPDGRDDLAGDCTSKLSPYLRFGCLSPLELAVRGEAQEEFVRQLCWRDFYHQVALAFPEINRRDYRRRPGLEWREDKDAAQAWREGQTGVPIVDAGMRQLAGEGWMHNRARMITAAYLVKHLRVDWRVGAGHFFDLLLDGDVANNSGNWQWIAGTGNDTRPNRSFNPVRQARRFDPEGDYIRRYVPELDTLPVKYLHEPWRLPTPVAGYPAPLTPFGLKP